MKKKSLVFFLILSQIVLGQKTKTSSTVTVLVTYTQQYCGGARPPEDLLKELATPKPYTNKALFIKKGTKNDFNNPILYSVKTNEKGEFSIKLPLGNYIIVDELKDTKLKYDNVLSKYSTKTASTGLIDTACYLGFFNSPDFSFSIIKSQLKKTVKKTYNYPKNCNWSGSPCVPFTGNYPP